MFRVVHFEIGALEPDRAIDFYKSLFDWKFQYWGEGDGEYWVITTGESVPGIDGGLFKRTEKASGDVINSYQCVIEVPDILSYEEKIRQAGGEITTSRMPISWMGWYAQCRDTEGNSFSIMQNDESAR